MSQPVVLRFLAVQQSKYICANVLQQWCLREFTMTGLAQWSRQINTTCYSPPPSFFQSWRVLESFSFLHWDNVTMILLFSGGSMSWLSHLKLFNNLYRSCWVAKSQSHFLVHYFPPPSFFSINRWISQDPYKDHPSQSWLQWEGGWEGTFTVIRHKLNKSQ